MSVEEKQATASFFLAPVFTRDVPILNVGLDARMLGLSEKPAGAPSGGGLSAGANVKITGGNYKAPGGNTWESCGKG